MTKYKNATILFRSMSGDWFDIPAEQYRADVAGYRLATQRALSTGDESGMIQYEQGDTGWRYNPSFMT